MRDASRCSALGWVARLESWGTHRAGALALRKPFSPRGVHELVRMLQRQRGGAFASRLRAGDTRGTQGRLRPVPQQCCSAGGCHFDTCRAFEHLHPLRAGIPHDRRDRICQTELVSYRCTPCFALIARDPARSVLLVVGSRRVGAGGGNERTYTRLDVGNRATAVLKRTLNQTT